MSNLGTFLKKQIGGIAVVIIVALLLICGVISTNAKQACKTNDVSMPYQHLSNKLSKQAVKADKDTSNAVSKTLKQMTVTNKHESKSAIKKSKEAASSAQNTATNSVADITSQDKNFIQIHEAMIKIIAVTKHIDNSHLTEAQTAISKIQDKAVRHHLDKTYTNDLKKLVSQVQ